MEAKQLEALSRILVCPSCHGTLQADKGGLRCDTCNTSFPVDRHGYVEFRVDGGGNEVYEQDTTGDEYVETQKVFSLRAFEEYLRPIISEAPFQTLLDAGCGMGMGVSALIDEGREAYGIDLPNHAKYWARSGKDPLHFFCADVGRLPFPDVFYDVVYCLGVFEHIGTVLGFSTLCDNHEEIRQACADELLRVLKPGGRLLVACPSKRFPIDIQHGPVDDLTRRTPAVRVRSSIYDRTGINIHPTWGENHLLSYRDARRLFVKKGGASGCEPLPLKGYFGFSSFRRQSLRPLMALARFYVENLPGFLRTTWVNPYMLVKITK